MLTTFIIVSFICWIIGFFINGFTLYNIVLLIPTIMFSVRKIGIHLKFGNIVTCEGLFLFFSIMWRLLFNSFHIIPLLLSILVRLVFMIIVYYDDTTFVYVQEERKKV